MTSTEETWLPVIGLEGLYEVSSLGRVRTVERLVPCGPGSKGVRHVRSIIRKVRPGKDGYLTVELCRKTYRVHKLVAEAFVGPRPTAMDVCHNDGNPINNAVENLRYGTKAENQIDSVRHGTNFHSRKTHCPRGHAYDETNTIREGSHRICRTCKNALWMERHRAKQRAASRART